MTEPNFHDLTVRVLEGEDPSAILSEARLKFEPLKKSAKDGSYWKLLDVMPGLKESDVIRVFHGFRDSLVGISAVKHGLSGSERVGRVYGYENNNNPKGLFVTTDFDKAGEFSSSVGISFVIEFNARVSELAAPVWPGGSFPMGGVGQMEKYFNNKADRQKEVKAARKYATDRADFPVLSRSSRPELAASLLLSGESQALFMSDLDPNRITTVHARYPVKGDDGREYQRTDTPWVAMSRKDFLKKHGKIEKQKVWGYDYEKKDSAWIDKVYDEPGSDKLFRPAETFDPKVFMDRWTAERGMRADELLDVFKKWWADQSEYPTGRAEVKRYLQRLLWPKQVVVAMKWAKRGFLL
jgi:hypothetical protein